MPFDKSKQQHRRSRRSARQKQQQSSSLFAAGIPTIQITVDEVIDDGEKRRGHCKNIEKKVTNFAAADNNNNGKQNNFNGTKKAQTAGRNVVVTTTAADERSTPQLDAEKGAQADNINNNNNLLSANKYQDRSATNRQSTGTLNRLILVAQALESEVNWRRRKDLNSSRIVFTLRVANIILLLLINLLIFTGVGQYHDRNGMHITLFLTLDKWNYQPIYPVEEIPLTFSEMNLTGQFCAAFLAIAALLATVLLQSVHCLQVKHPKSLCVFYAFSCVPLALFVFGLEMHYSACPWLDDFYQSQLLLRRNFNSMEKYFETQCGVNGWALAGIFSLLSCGLFVSDGLISAFLRHDDARNNEQAKIEDII